QQAPPAATAAQRQPQVQQQVAAHALGLPRIGKGLAKTRQFVFDPATQIGVGIDPSVTQAVSATSGVWDVSSGQLVADQVAQCKLTNGQVKHADGLNNARCTTQRWLAPFKPHLQHLAAASSADTSLVANLKHITVTLATWDAVWEVYLDPKWARQRLRLYGAQDRALEQFFNKLEEGMAEVSMERHGRAKQLVVFFGAASISTGGGWGADAVLRACCMVVCRPRGTDQRRSRVVLADEHRTNRVSSAVNGQQPCERQLNKRRATRPADWKPLAGQVEPRLVRPAWSQQRDQRVQGLMWCPVVPPRNSPQAPCSSQEATQAAASEPGPSTPPPAKRSKPAAEPTKGRGKAKGKAAKPNPALQPGRWLDRDCNAALNMPRIGKEVLSTPDSTSAVCSACAWVLGTLLSAVPCTSMTGGMKTTGAAALPQLLATHWGDSLSMEGVPPSDMIWAHFTAKRNISARCENSFLVAGHGPVPQEAFVKSPRESQDKHIAQRLGISGRARKRTKRTKVEPAAEPTKGKGKAQGKAAKAKPAPQPGRWVDRDCNAALNMQRIGESRWRPLKLCWWLEHAALPTKGKEYPGLGYKRLQDKPPKTQPAAAQ
ncbi:hypothetical protein QJQ45_015079, partial [Haematococcus lacustris]